ncbi:hypothetical protein TB1_035342 [Malus domestica]
MNSDGKPQGLHLRPHKGTYLGSFYFLDSALPEEPCLKSLARRDLPDKSCPTKPDREVEARQQAQPVPTSQGSCVLVGQESIPDGNSCHEHSFGTPGGISNQKIEKQICQKTYRPRCFKCCNDWRKPPQALEVI